VAARDVRRWRARVQDAPVGTRRARRLDAAPPPGGWSGRNAREAAMSSLPQEMTYIAHGAGGGTEVLVPARGPLPAPQPDEVLIRVLAAGVNRPDVAQRTGAYPPPPGASPILGLECAGEVVATGAAVTRYRPGDRVCALTNGGAYAEYCTAPEAQTLPWPAGTDAIRAAALPETYFTVWANLFGHGRLAAGETVLVHGGTSGIGVTAIQLAKAFSARVVATAGSAEKCAACLRLGADAAIDYRTQDFAEQVKAFTGGRGVDVILDMVGAAYLARNLRALALDGRLVIIAFLGGHQAEAVDLRPIMVKRLTVTGSTMRPRTTAQKGAIAAELEAKVWPLLAQGRCGPVIHATFPLAEAAAAHALMESSAHIGKIMLRVAA
jgi:NADPH2:quinone reductase